MVFNAIFNNISVIFYFIGVGNREYPKKTTELLQFIDHLYHIMLRWILLDMTWFDHPSSFVIGTDCICGCKPSYHTIMITMAVYCCTVSFQFMKYMHKYWLLYEWHTYPGCIWNDKILWHSRNNYKIKYQNRIKRRNR